MPNPFDALDTLLGVPQPPSVSPSVQAAPQVTSAFDRLDDLLGYGGSERAPHEQRMAHAMQRARAGSESHGGQEAATYLAHRLPLLGPVARLTESETVRGAEERVAANRGTNRDYEIAANARVEAERAQNQSTLASMGDALTYVPGMVGEAYLGGAMLSAAAPAVGAAPSLLSRGAYASRGTLGLAAARVAATNTLTPSMYLPQAGERAAANGGNWYDPSNLGVAWTMGFAQTAILGSLAGAADNIQGAGVGSFAKRLAARTFVGMGEQGIADVVGGAVDSILPEAYQTRTRYGLLGNALRGEWGEFGKHFATQAVTFAAFSALHPILHGERQPEQPGAQPSPVPPEPGVQGGLPAVGPMGQPLGPREAGVTSPTPARPELGEGMPRPGVPRPQEVLQAASDAVNGMGSQLSREAVMKRLSSIGDKISAASMSGDPKAMADVAKEVAKLKGDERVYAEKLLNMVQGAEEAARSQAVPEQQVAPNHPQETPPQAQSLPPIEWSFAEPPKAKAPETAPSAQTPTPEKIPAEARPEARVTQPEPIPAAPEPAPAAEQRAKPTEMPSDPTERLYQVAKERGLTKREANVMLLRAEGRTLDEIGNALGVTRERIRQVEEKALGKLGVEGSVADLIHKGMNAPDVGTRADYTMPETASAEANATVGAQGHRGNRSFSNMNVNEQAAHLQDVQFQLERVYAEYKREERRGTLTDAKKAAFQERIRTFDALVNQASEAFTPTTRADSGSSSAEPAKIEPSRVGYEGESLTDGMRKLLADDVGAIDPQRAVDLLKPSRSVRSFARYLSVPLPARK